MKELWKRFRRWWFNSNAPTGCGGCCHCGDRWNWKKEHNIPINEFESMFPYCEECNGILSISEKIDYVDSLIDRWCMCNPRKMDESEAKGLLAKEAVRNGK